MIALLIRLGRCRAGGAAAEFGLVLPLLLLLIFMVIDAGRVMFTWNLAEKATQMGVRYAVVTNMIPSGLASYSFALSGGIIAGEPIPQSAFGGVRCDNAGCTCKTGMTCPALGTPVPGAFQNIVNQMRLFYPEIQAANVLVDYDYSGLGYAGDPTGPDVSPLVTVRLRNLTFTPITLLGMGPAMSLPDFSATLTQEDAAGTVSN